MSFIVIMYGQTPLVPLSQRGKEGVLTCDGIGL